VNQPPLSFPELRLPDPVRKLALRLAASDELPGYVYDLSALDEHAARIRAALPAGVEFYYAAKANPDPRILHTVARHADGIEVSSGGELHHVTSAVPGKPLAFSGPGKTESELRAAVGAGALVHVESVNELRLLAAIAGPGGADILLRANLDVPIPGEAALTMGGSANPFGMNARDLDRCTRLLPGTGLRLRGLHAHLASGLGPTAALAAADGVLRFARGWCARAGVAHPVITLGGGMAVDYRRPGDLFGWEEYGRGLAERTRSGETLPGETLRIEPGRSVSVYCGWYVTRVLDVKQGDGPAFAVVAGGTHHLRTPAAKGHDQPFAVLPDETWPHPWPRDETSEPVTVTGQLCTPKDALARGVRAGRVRTGDIIVFGLAGAYAWNISHTSFLMHPQPGFHYIDK
jgi:diaminopimelate decarboxylase